ncbi:hypothetical protein GOA58_05865 [Sinorhizobium meliloti]|uniref:hypothetical protein n=1 Tax=Rhizobium meliloti TaxID=382 RepID=UPI00299DC168|nr:hypothetical protein [Sinorhizobium meliloti]MDW9660102.1 hypothetical protein [Sinorhizobium meliloti]MDX0049671.1 hypothetical protein [Sinorhizobium meliloti]
MKPKYVGYFNEFGNGLNPWKMIATHAIFDSSDLTGLKEAFEHFGLVVVRRVYDKEETQRFYELQKKFCGIGDEDIKRVVSGEIKPVVGGTPALTEPGFWPLIVNENTKRIVAEILPGVPATEFGTSAGAHYSARGLHRDFPQWYKMPKSGMSLERPSDTSLRILIYPSKQGVTAGTFGAVPFSHRRDLYERYAKQLGIKHSFDWFEMHRDLIKKAVATGDTKELDEMESNIDWVAADPGDVVLLDSKMQHSGDFITGPRYLFTTSFAKENEFILNTLRQRWSTGMKPHEVGYYEYLHANGLASEQLVHECRAYAAKAA